MQSEPKITPSVVAAIPDVLKNQLLEMVENKVSQQRRSMLISSNGLSNRFIYTRWGIRPSQRRRNKNLFAKIREQSRILFRHLLEKQEIEVKCQSGTVRFGVYSFDEVRGNMILGFVQKDDDCPFM